MAFTKTGTPEKRNIIAYRSEEIPDESVFDDEEENEDGEGERDGSVPEFNADNRSSCPKVSRR